MELLARRCDELELVRGMRLEPVSCVAVAMEGGRRLVSVAVRPRAEHTGGVRTASATGDGIAEAVDAALDQLLPEASPVAVGRANTVVPARRATPSAGGSRPGEPGAAPAASGMADPHVPSHHPPGLTEAEPSTGRAVTWVNTAALLDRAFPVVRKGYDRDEVDGFRRSVADLCEQLRDERDDALRLAGRAERELRRLVRSRRAEHSRSRHRRSDGESSLPGRPSNVDPVVGEQGAAASEEAVIDLRTA